jgi:hypothetical protein
VRAVALAKVYEEKYTPTIKPQKANPNYYNKPPVNSTKPENSQRKTTPILNTPPTRPMSQFQKNPNIKRISPAEMQLRRGQGTMLLV